MKSIKALIILSTCGFFTSCVQPEFKETKIFAGGKMVSADTLNLGKNVYMESCFACHGQNGEGKGVAAKGMTPAPRNLKLGVYKFGNVISGGLPHDEDFIRIIQNGLHGTAMLPWDIQGERLDAVVQYIKTFAPQVWEGQDKKLGDKIPETKDAFGDAHKAAALARGKVVYHMIGQCFTCHRAYATREEFNKMSMEVNKEPYSDFDPEVYTLKLQESDHGHKTMPPDFTWHEVRSGKTVKEIKERIAYGVGGTAMASWHETLDDQDLWAVSHYIKSLMDLKNTPARKELMDKLK